MNPKELVNANFMKHSEERSRAARNIVKAEPGDNKSI